MTKIDSGEILKKLQPFNRLEDEEIQTLEQKGQFLQVSSHTVLFKRGDRAEFCYWLISGNVDLITKDHGITSVEGGSAEAKRVLDQSNPHLCSAVVTSESEVFKVSRLVVDFMTKLIDSNHYMVSDVRDTHEVEADWMSGLLSSPVFELIPPSSLMQLLRQFEEVTAEAGEAVIEQGDIGSYFYVIRSGTARVEQTFGGTSQTLANLGVGASFGEDALISEVPRNATIIMTSAGRLMRLSKEIFGELLQTPVLSQLEKLEANSLAEEDSGNTPLFLDVRNPEEVGDTLPVNHINIPLLQLRDRKEELDPNVTYITRSGGGKRGALAAFILNRNGIGAYVLKED